MQKNKFSIFSTLAPGVTDPATMGSRGRNLIGNIKQKFWTDKTRKLETHPPPIISTPEPERKPENVEKKMFNEKSRSNSHLSLKSHSSNNDENEEFFVPLSQSESNSG